MGCRGWDKIIQPNSRFYYSRPSRYDFPSRSDSQPKAVNVPLLYEIARIKGYAKGWVYFKLKELRAKGKPAI